MDVTQQLDPSTLFSAKDLVIVITGGGSGIGLALTAALFQTGAKKVYILGRRIETLKTGAQTVDPSLKTVIPVQCDITSTSSINACVQQIKTDVDYIDVLINNAGITGPGHKDIYSATTLEDVAADLLKQPEEWESTMATNTTAINFVSASFLRLLDAGNVRRGYESGKVEGRARTRDPTIGKANGVDETDERSSQIISVTSISAFNRHITAGLAYTASKAGATLIGKTLATLLAPWGIRSNVISPGIYPSEMNTKTNRDYPPNLIPLGRAGNLNDIAGTILYLVGQSGAYINGAVEVTDGGRLGMFQTTF